MQIHTTARPDKSGSYTTRESGPWSAHARSCKRAAFRRSCACRSFHSRGRSCDLHGDRACALRRAAVHEVAQPCPRNADEIDAAVLVEAVILDREDGLLHLVGNLVEAHDAPPLLAK